MYRMTTDILRTRQLHLLKATAAKQPACIIYVMSRDQRVQDNYALVIAQQEALRLELPLVVVFNLLPHTGVRAREHYDFMLDGLEQVAARLDKLNISFVMTYGVPTEAIPEFCRSYTPAHLYFDFNPLPAVRAMQTQLGSLLDTPITVVDTHNIIPAWVTSDKQEFAAHTIRRKVHHHLETYLTEPPEIRPHPHDLAVTGISFAAARQYVQDIPTAGISIEYASGEEAARHQLQQFTHTELSSYATGRNDIASDHQSGLSPYLHFGQIASQRVALEVLYETSERPLLFDAAQMAQASTTASKRDGMDALFEEMIVRKELSDNFCLYTSDVTSLSAAPDWAQRTLHDHASDPREHVYSRAQLEQADTHDDIWNAAQRQLTKTGKLHGYMRMYWAKKLLEWTPDPQTAIDIAVYLNDHYSIDGGDPNGYVGILWSIAGLHDRPWTERPVFGKVRYMNAAGLRRKFDVDTYVNTWSAS